MITNKANKKCTDCGACNDTAVKQNKNVDTKADAKTELGYSFYSNVLNQPFKSLSELAAAEAKHFEQLKAKEDAAAKKKADAKVVEDAFKELNAARKVYKEDLTQLTTEYAEALDNLKKAFELGKKDITNRLANAEEAYEKALKDFTNKHDQFHLTLRDGDFETTISGSSKVNTANLTTNDIFDVFDLIFNF
jgi:uncharacterized membrane protein YkoI